MVPLWKRKIYIYNIYNIYIYIYIYIYRAKPMRRRDRGPGRRENASKEIDELNNIYKITVDNPKFMHVYKD